jgi:hypothetical protein
MKKFSFLLLLAVSLSAAAQDSTHKWSLTVGLDIGLAGVNKITGTDTSLVNALALAPSISLGRSNFFIGYSPKFLMGGSNPGLYMHAISAGMSQYDKDAYSYAVTYSHYFFVGNKSIPYTPLTNEIYSSFTYKKPWLRPGITAGLGFGRDKSVSPAVNAYDIGLAAGVSHSFDWDIGDVSISAAPSVYLSAGTNDYFSYLSSTKYIGRSAKSGKYAKKGSKKNSGGSGGATTAAQTTKKTLDLSNIDLGVESSVDVGRFTMRSELNVYVPVGTNAGSGLSTYWQISLQYKLW